jgi:hypothetical protein
LAFRAASRLFREFSALLKARAAHGVSGPLDDVAKVMREKFPRTVHSDPQGSEFPQGVSLTRHVDEEEAPPVPPSATRIRPHHGARRGARSASNG